MAPPILGNEISQMRAQAHVRNGRLDIAPFMHWETLEKDETLSI